MGKKIDALLGRNFRPSKFKPTVNIALSRLSILKNQRQARHSVARSDVVELLNLGHHDRALLRVEQVIREQNMLDVYAMIEGYCHLLIERINLLENEKVCPDELVEVISSLIYASTRCGDFPELQEIRSVFTSRFGKEFAARAIELRNNCGVNPRIIQKLSTRQPGLESKLEVLREIASESWITLNIEEHSSMKTVEKLDIQQKLNQTKLDPPMNSEENKLRDNSPTLHKDMDKVEGFSDSMKERKKYRNVAAAAQAAFESAAYAAEAAREAMELSRSKSNDPDDDDDQSPNFRPRKVSNTHDPIKYKIQTGKGIEDRDVGPEFEKIHTMHEHHLVSEDAYIQEVKNAEGSKQNKNAEAFNRSVSDSSSGSVYNQKGTTFSLDTEGRAIPLGKEIVFDESDDESRNAQVGTSLLRNNDLGYDKKHIRHTKRVSRTGESYTNMDEDISEGNDTAIYDASRKQYPLRSEAALKGETGPVNSKLYADKGSRMQGSDHIKLDNPPMSVRTRRVYGE